MDMSLVILKSITSAVWLWFVTESDQNKTICWQGGGNSKIFFIFTTIWGRWTHFDEHIFQLGWFNHQLVVDFLPIWTCFSLTFSSLWSWVILGPGLSPRAVSRASGLLWTLGTEGAFWGTDPIQYDFELVFGKSHKIPVVSKVRCACCFPPIFFNASNGSAGLVFQFQRCVTIRKLAIEPKRMPLLSWNLGSWNCNQKMPNLIVDEYSSWNEYWIQYLSYPVCN